MKNLILWLVIFLCKVFIIHGRLPKPGLIKAVIVDGQTTTFVRSLYKGATISIAIQTPPCDAYNTSFNFYWKIKGSSCIKRRGLLEKMSSRTSNSDQFYEVLFPEILSLNSDKRSNMEVIPCGGVQEITFNYLWEVSSSLVPMENGDIFLVSHNISRADSPSVNKIAVAPKDGFYTIFASLSAQNNAAFETEIIIKIKNENGYLSKDDLLLQKLYFGYVLISLFISTVICVLNRFNLGKIQHVHAGLLHIILFQVAYGLTSFLNFNFVNKNGLPSLPIDLMTLFFNTCAEATFRLIVMLLSNGFGDYRFHDTVKYRKPNVFVLLYVAVSMLSIYELGVDNFSLKQAYFVGVCLIDILIACFVFVSSVRIKALEKHINGLPKRGPHKSLVKVMLFCAASSIAMTIFLFYCSLEFCPCQFTCHLSWLSTASWWLLQFTFMICVVFIYRPTSELVKYNELGK